MTPGSDGDDEDAGERQVADPLRHPLAEPVLFRLVTLFMPHGRHAGRPVRSRCPGRRSLDVGPRGAAGRSAITWRSSREKLYCYNDCMPATTQVSTAETDALLTASRVLVAVAARSLAEHEAEVSLQQYRALVVLGSRGAQRPVDLPQALSVDPST